MGDFDVAALAEQPIALAAAVGVLGILLFIVFGRKSYGPVPKQLKAFSKIPGPAGLPLLGNLLSYSSLKPQAHLLWTQWANTYGKIYQYTVRGRTVVVVSDPSVLPAVLGGDGLGKSPLASLGEGALSKDAHAGLAPAFGPEGAKAQFAIAQQRTLDFAAHIDKNGTERPIEMQASLEDVVLDVLLTAAFDVSPDKLEPFRAPLRASLRAASLAAAGPISNPLWGDATKSGKKAADAAWAELVKGLRRRGPAAKSDNSLSAALSRLADASGDPLSDETLASQVAALAVAALEPTAQSVAWALFSIATTPSLQDGIAKELGEAGLLAHGEDREPRPISFEDLSKLTYLQAVIKESQRLFPAAAIGPLRYAEKNTELAGYFIPKGTHVQVPLHTLHTAAWNWPQPERFWPERWTSPELRGGPKNGVGIDGLKTAFLPFGASCISARVAETQVAAIVAVLASRFKFALSGGGRKAALQRQMLDSSLRLAGGMKMVFVPRASIGFSSRL